MQKIDFSKFVYAYAISGGIGSGKSSVCRILSNLGYEVLDADKIAHQVLQECCEKIEEVFGRGVVEEGKVNRKALAKIVFDSKERLQTLQDIVNPYIYHRLFAQCQRLEKLKKPYFVEIALLFEQREVLNFVHKVLILSDEEVVLERVQKRDNVSREEVLKRMSFQLPCKEKIPFATSVIINDSDYEGLEEKIKQWIKTL